MHDCNGSWPIWAPVASACCRMLPDSDAWDQGLLGGTGRTATWRGKRCWAAVCLSLHNNGAGMADLSPHQIQQLAAVGRWGGPSYRYRDAAIHCCPGGHVCGLVLRDHPLNSVTFGAVGTITPLVDAWLDEGRLPRHIRQRSKP